MNRKRIPIIIDGLNESVVNGKLSEIWSIYLSGLIDSIKKYSELFLVILYRPTYEQCIFTEEKLIIDCSFVLSGLKEEGILVYLEYYHLDISIPYRLINVLSNPLFLRIFCETYGLPIKDAHFKQGVLGIEDQ